MVVQQQGAVHGRIIILLPSCASAAAAAPSTSPIIHPSSSNLSTHQTKPGSVIRALDLYKSTLTIYGHELVTLKVPADNEVADNGFGTPSVLTRSSSSVCDGNDVPHKELKALAMTQATENGDENDDHLPLALLSPDNEDDDDEEVTPWPDFDNRIDSVAVLLARQSPNLSVLVS